MVGLCGVIGPDRCGHHRLEEPLGRRGDETTASYTDDRLAVTVSSHSADDQSQPSWTEDGDVGFWVWGDIWGFDHPDRDGDELPTGPPADYCASLYNTYGFEFVAGLNGNFVGLAYDRTDGTVTFFTDRLGTRPLHYVRTDESVVFSTDVQSLPRHPAVQADFDVEYLAEYFALKRAFGVKTPLEGVELLQPGSLTTVSTTDLAVDAERYWRPVHQPQKRSPAHFAGELADVLAQAARERTNADTRYGLLLSGGSDSRLMLAALSNAGLDVHAFHVNDWFNREARIARRAAEAVGAEFTFLRRDADYQARALASNSSMSTFGGYFNQVHAAGFEETLAEEVDVLFTGHYGDMLFKGDHLPTPTIDLGRLGSFSLPVERTVTTVEDLLDHRDEETPTYLTDALHRSIREIYAANVDRRGGRIVDHGVEYESLREAVLCSRCMLPNSPSHFFYYGTLQMMPSGTLFLDNRLVDLFLTIPTGTLLRGNLINRAVDRLSPALADIPHGNTGTPLSAPFARHWLGGLATSFKDRYMAPAGGDAHWSQGPWPDHNELVRSHGFIRETLDENEDVVRGLPFLSWDGVNACYEAHMAGQDNWKELYTLVTFLNMPVVQQASGTDSRRSRPAATDGCRSECSSTRNETTAGRSREGTGSLSMLGRRLLTALGRGPL